MAWTNLPTDYEDAVWAGLKKYTQVNNEDGTVSFRDMTVYTKKEKSFFGAADANAMNAAMNQLAGNMDTISQKATQATNAASTATTKASEAANSAQAAQKSAAEAASSSALVLTGVVGNDNSIIFDPLSDGQNPYTVAKAAYVAGRVVQIDVRNTAGDWNTILILSRYETGGNLLFFNCEKTLTGGANRLQYIEMLTDSTATYSYISVSGGSTEVPTKTSQLTNDSGYLTLETLPKYGGEST